MGSPPLMKKGGALSPLNWVYLLPSIPVTLSLLSHSLIYFFKYQKNRLKWCFLQFLLNIRFLNMCNDRQESSLFTSCDVERGRALLPSAPHFYFSSKNLIPTENPVKATRVRVLYSFLWTVDWHRDGSRFSTAFNNQTKQHDTTHKLDKKETDDIIHTVSLNPTQY